MASAWAIVARTEYREGVRSRWFLVGTVLGPVLLAAAMIVPAYLTARGAGKPVRVALVDRSSERIGPLVAAALELAPGETRSNAERRAHFTVELVPDAGQGAGHDAGHDAGHQDDLAVLDRRVASDALDGYLVLPVDVTRGGAVIYSGSDASSMADMARLQRALQAAVLHARAQASGLADGQIARLLEPVELDARQATGKGAASGGAAFMVAYFVAFLLYMMIVLYGASVMRSVLQEKTSRVMEVVASCARPGDLMLGKIAGAGAVGLTQMMIWVAAGFWMVHHRGALLARFGIEGAGAIALPSIGVPAVACVAAFFLGGYFLYAALFAAIGAANNSDREAQQAVLPVTVPLILAFLCIPAVTAAPRDGLAVALTMVPLFSPVLMPMRYLLTTVPAWQVAGSLLLLAATLVATIWAAGRIYRVGILMYGKRPTPRELWRWMRARG